MKFVDFLEDKAPPKRAVVEFHQALVDHLSNRNGYRLVRHGGGLGRGICQIVDGISVVGCDNEPAVWAYSRLGSEDRPWLQQSIQSLIVGRLLPVTDSRTKNVDARFCSATIPRPWGTGFQHKHIFDARSRVERLNLPIAQQTQNQLNSQFMRLMNPLNHFLFPSHSKHLAEQTGDPRYQAVAAKFMHEYYGETFMEFLHLAGVDKNSSWREIAEICYGDLLLPEGSPSSTFEVFRSVIVLNYASQQQASKRIPIVRMEAPYQLHLSWRRDTGQPEVFVGEFSLDLKELLVGRFIRQEGNSHLRLIIRRTEEGQFFIQLNQNSPAFELD